MKCHNHPYEQHIFVCTNSKDGEGGCCHDKGGYRIFRALRDEARNRGLHPKIRIAQATCLGYCGQGVNIMAYPSMQWYSGVEAKDMDLLISEFFS